MVYAAKYVLLATQIEKKLLLQKKLNMKILGIGNAIVDVICKVEDSFITQNSLTKSTMKLFFDENEFRKLLTNLKIEKTISGGSVANSIVGISQLGDKAGFIGKISDDEFGIKYEDGLKKENVEFFYKKKKNYCRQAAV
jgi:sugar/nucleoside kinase (ribokinase family)